LCKDKEVISNIFIYNNQYVGSMHSCSEIEALNNINYCDGEWFGMENTLRDICCFCGGGNIPLPPTSQALQPLPPAPAGGYSPPPPIPPTKPPNPPLPPVIPPNPPNPPLPPAPVGGYSPPPPCINNCHVPGCTISNSINFNSNATYNDGSCINDLIYGCSDSNAYNFNPGIVELYVPCLYKGCMDSTHPLYNSQAGISVPCLSIYGCRDTIAVNYDRFATISDNTCVYKGCMDPGNPNYNPSAYVRDDTDCKPTYKGCTDSYALNYNSIYTQKQRCRYIGCMDTTSSNYDSQSNFNAEYMC
jgi:hypothetical protein